MPMPRGEVQFTHAGRVRHDNRNPHRIQEEVALEMFGLKLSGRAPCPHVVLGRYRCPMRAGRTKDCICQRYAHNVLDHGRLWRDKDTGEWVLTGEPYNIDGGTLAEFIADMGALGLDVRFSGVGCWFPGFTFTVLVRRKAAP